MYCDLSLKLTADARRLLSLPSLPTYQAELVRGIVQETNELAHSVSETLAPYSGSFNPSSNPAVAASVLIDHLCMKRNKRCLLAYHFARTRKLDSVLWEGGDPLDSSGSSVTGIGNLSPEEEEYVRGYSALLSTLKGEFIDIDLTAPLDPPRDLFVDVRVLKDGPEIQTEYGAIQLNKNSQFFVRRADVSNLVKAGYLAILE